MRNLENLRHLWQRQAFHAAQHEYRTVIHAQFVQDAAQLDERCLGPGVIQPWATFYLVGYSKVAVKQRTPLTFPRLASNGVHRDRNEITSHPLRAADALRIFHEADEYVANHVLGIAFWAQ